MRIYALLAAMLLSGSMVFAQSPSDPTIMTINGHKISRSEFEYSYNKNNTEGVIDKKSVDEYVDLFINYKLKVQAALDAHLDTMKSFIKEFHTYRDQQIRPSFINDADVEAMAHSIYNDTYHRIDSMGGLVRPAHILFRVSQKASKAQIDSARDVAMKVYAQLVKGADFRAMSDKYSQDPGAVKRGGDIGWISKGQTVPEFEKAVFAMKKGEISKPVETPFGFHIIKLEDKCVFLPYDSLKNDIHRFIKQRGLREKIINDNISKAAKADGIGDEDELDRRADAMSAKDSNLKYLIQEYHDGLLLYEISNRTIWSKAAADEKGLAYYFKKNKSRYAWDKPRFKGMAYHVKTQSDVAAVRKSVEGKPFGDWAEILRTTFNNDSTIRIRVEKGIFKEGMNALVDKEIFHKDTTVTTLKDYPINAVYGKVLKKGPEDYTDVREQVVADYQEELEKHWVADLRKHYDFTIDRTVLATVNKH